MYRDPLKRRQMRVDQQQVAGESRALQIARDDRAD
jgi:hypothetical protein